MPKDKKKAKKEEPKKEEPKKEESEEESAEEEVQSSEVIYPSFPIHAFSSLEACTILAAPLDTCCVCRVSSRSTTH